eukprot:scpid47804/ scgid5083/ 
MYVVLCEPYKILQLTPAFPTGPYVPYRQRSVECELGFMHVSTHLLQKRSSVYHDSAACTTIQQRVPRFSSMYHDSAACTTIQQHVPRFSSVYHDSAACTTIQQRVPRFSSMYHDSAACTTIQQHVPRFSSVYHDSAACTTIQQRAPRFSSMYNTIPHRKKTSSPEDESKTNEAQKIEEDRSEKTERGKK